MYLDAPLPDVGETLLDFFEPGDVDKSFAACFTYGPETVCPRSVDIASAPYGSVAPWAMRVMIPASSPGRCQSAKWSPGISIACIARDANRALASLRVWLSAHPMNVDGTVRQLATLTARTWAA